MLRSAIESLHAEADEPVADIRDLEAAGETVDELRRLVGWYGTEVDIASLLDLIDEVAGD